MSKEKECKCCHEWWYASDIKQDLCPNCYDYFKQLKQQLAERDKKIERLKFFEKAYYYNQLQASQEDRQKFQNLANQGAVNINYKAIQKLEKLRNDIWELDIGDYYLQNGGTIENIKVKRKDVCDLIDNQIKELKGE